MKELVKDHHDILRMVQDLAADDARDHYVKQVAGSAENLIDALCEEVKAAETYSKSLSPTIAALREEVDRLKAQEWWQGKAEMLAELERLGTDNTILAECVKDTIHQIQCGCFNDEEWTTSLINGLRGVLAALQKFTGEDGVSGRAATREVSLQHSAPQAPSPIPLSSSEEEIAALDERLTSYNDLHAENDRLKRHEQTLEDNGLTHATAIAEIYILRAEVERLREALKFYANRANYNELPDHIVCAVEIDEGEKARAALQSKGEQ